MKWPFYIFTVAVNATDMIRSLVSLPRHDHHALGVAWWQNKAIANS